MIVKAGSTTLGIHALTYDDLTDGSRAIGRIHLLPVLPSVFVPSSADVLTFALISIFVPHLRM
jgi:hypothetical protein